MRLQCVLFHGVEQIHWPPRGRIPNPFGYLLLHLITLVLSDVQGHQVNQEQENNVFAPDIPDFF
jgi:hypothetical protein